MKFPQRREGFVSFGVDWNYYDPSVYYANDRMVGFLIDTTGNIFVAIQAIGNILYEAGPVPPGTKDSDFGQVLELGPFSANSATVVKQIGHHLRLQAGDMARVGDWVLYTERCEHYAAPYYDHPAGCGATMRSVRLSDRTANYGAPSFYCNNCDLTVPMAVLPYRPR